MENDKLKQDAFGETTPPKDCGSWEGKTLAAKFNTTDKSIVRTAGVAPAVGTLKVELLCATKKSKLTARLNNGSTEETNETTTTTGGSVALKNDESVETKGLQNYVDKVATGEMCISASEGDTKLIWNLEKFIRSE